MDPLSTGASVLAFVVLALKSAKAVHQLISLVKDAPRNVHDLGNEVQNLVHILGRLACMQHASAAESDRAAIADLATGCLKDVTAIEDKLRSLTISADDRRTGRLWKKLRSVISDGDIVRARDTVRSYVLNLDFWINLAHAETFAEHATVSQEQSGDIVDLLKQLQVQVADLQTRVDGTSSPAGYVLESSRQDQLVESIARLCSLVSEKECTMASDDAEQIIDDLRLLLTSACGDLRKYKAIEKADSGNDDVEEIERCAPRDLDMAQCLVGSAASIAINSRSMS